MAAFVPGFEHDLFISYAHQDDERWVQAFEEELSDEVSRRLGLPLSIWQDSSRLRAGENWQAAIRDGVRHSAAFVTIVSPSYQNSRWCARERSEFRRQFDATRGDCDGRFFKAVKTPWPDNGHSLFFQELQGVDFFKADEHGPREFTPGSREFKRAIRKLADGIEPLLRRMRRRSQRVHVAWPLDECLAAWEQLNAELRNKGFDVQPTGPRDASFADPLLASDLERAVLSIHLLGSTYDPFTERLALLAADLDHRLMFWVAPGASAPDDARQQEFLGAIRRGVRPGTPNREWPLGWSLLTEVGIRPFIETVLATLKAEATVPLEQVRQTGAASVYIVHDPTTPEDRAVALDIKERISNVEGMNVFLSRADLPSPTEQKLWHEQLLRSCDGVLLFRQSAPEGWWNQLAPEVILAERRFERPPIKSRAFLLPHPPGWEVGPNVKVLPYQAPFQMTQLEPFLTPLRGQTGAQL